MCKHIEYNMAKVFRVSSYTAAKFRSSYLNVFTVLTIGYLGEEQLLCLITFGAEDGIWAPCKLLIKLVLHSISQLNRLQIVIKN